MRRILMMMSGLCAVLCSQSLWAGDGLDTWALRPNPLPSTNWLYSIIYAYGQFVAVGGTSPPRPQGAGIVVASADGTNWIQSTIPSGTGTLQSITSGNGIYVGAGRGRTIITSLDGKSWAPSFSGGWGYSAVAYGNNLFVAGSYTYIYTSTNNANTWASYPLGLFEFSFSSIAYGNKEFVAVGGTHGGGGIFTSTNGSTWSGRLSDYLVRSIYYAGGIYVAVGGKGTVKTSLDATTWITRDSGTTNNLLSVACGGGFFVAVGSGGTILTSTDAKTWTPRTSGVTNDLTTIVFGNGRFVAVGANATILESGPIIRLGSPAALSKGAMQFTVSGPVGQSCQIQISTDLVNWAALTDTTLAEPSTTLVIVPPTDFSRRFYRAVVP